MVFQVLENNPDNVYSLRKHTHAIYRDFFKIIEIVVKKIQYDFFYIFLIYISW